MQNLKFQLQVVAELWQFMFSLDFVIFCQNWHFLLIWRLRHFWKATVWLADKVRAWNCTGRYYTRYRRLLNKFHILAWLTKAKTHGSKALQSSSRIFCLNFKRVLEDMKTRYFICIWFFHINKRFLTILFHKNIKIIAHSWYFWSQKGLQDRISCFGTKLPGLIVHCAHHQKFWIFQHY